MVGAQTRAGMVAVRYGATGRVQWLSQSRDAERGDRFGAALASGDFDRDGRDELAVGVPGEDEAPNAPTGDGHGAVQVLAGPMMRQVGRSWGGRGRYDRFGSALARGDFSGDRSADLAVGAPGRGAVRLLRGGSGPASRGSRTIGSPSGPGGQFGWALLARRSGPGRESGLLIGAPGVHGFGGAVTQVAGTRVASLPLPGRGLVGFSFG